MHISNGININDNNNNKKVILSHKKGYITHEAGQYLSLRNGKLFNQKYKIHIQITKIYVYIYNNLSLYNANGTFY